MAEVIESDETQPQKASKIPIIIAVALAVVAGAGGFLAARADVLPFLPKTEKTADSENAKEKQNDEGNTIKELTDNAFIALKPMVISLRPGTRNRHLKFAATLDVTADQKDHIEQLSPKIVDILNGYLRAVKPADFEDPTILIKVRSQVLHRARFVAGNDAIRDVLITEFVLN